MVYSISQPGPGISQPGHEGAFLELFFDSRNHIYMGYI